MMDFKVNTMEGNQPNLDIIKKSVMVPFWKKYIDSFKPMEAAIAPNEDGLSSTQIKPELKRTLKNRHMQMIAFGGTIGTGLFIGSGGALADAGPASVLLGFTLIGSMLFNVVMALGELAVLFPVAGSYAVFSSRFIDPAWGFAMGWNIALGSLFTLPMELTAAAITMNYWGTSINPSVWITIFLLSVVAINFFGVRGYAEAESAFAMLKIAAVVGFIILGVIIDCGGAPAGIYLGAKTWSNPGAFNNGFQGFCAVFVTAAFAFGGTEMVGLAAAESEDPRESLPRATKQVFWRIFIFYIVSLLLIGLIVPFDHPMLLGSKSNSSHHGAAASPFVIAIQDAGIKVLSSIFNGVILISVLSVGNTVVYGSSRILYAMAQQGQAPKFLGYIDREGRPLFAIILALAIGALAYTNVLTSSELIFSWLLAIFGLSTFFTWLSICWAHLRFRKAWSEQGHTLDELPFTAALGVYGSWWGVTLNVLVLIAQFGHALWPIAGPATAGSFFKAYLAAPVTLMFYVVWKLYKKTPFMVTGKGRTTGHFLLRTQTIDLVTGRRQMDLASVLAQERLDREALPTWKRFYRSLCG